MVFSISLFYFLFYRVFCYINLLNSISPLSIPTLKHAMLVIHIDIQVTQYCMLMSLHIISDPFLEKAIYRWSLPHAPPVNVTSLKDTVKYLHFYPKNSLHSVETLWLVILIAHYLLLSSVILKTAHTCSLCDHLETQHGVVIRKY
jgi:hypothetical protein